MCFVAHEKQHWEGDLNYLALLGGGLFWVYLFSIIWEKAVFQRLVDDPVKGKVGATIAAYLTAVLVSMALGTGSEAFLFYLFGAVVVGVFKFRRGMQLRSAGATPDGVESTFD